MKVARVAVRQAIRAEPRPDMVRLGSDYGGWWIPAELVDGDSICYLAGVGEDATFDLALAEQFDCDVWAFDPTPRALTYVRDIADPRFHFLPVGLWATDETLRFYAPDDPSHVSHSATNMQNTAVGFEAPCLAVSSLMRQLGHSRLDLLKLDIEGAEVAVLADLLERGPLPRVLCVEFDAPEPPWRTLRRVRRLRTAGYRCVKAEDRNYTFVLK